MEEAVAQRSEHQIQTRELWVQILLKSLVSLVFKEKKDKSPKKSCECGSASGSVGWARLSEGEGSWVRVPVWSLKHGCVTVVRSWAVTSCTADQSASRDERRLDLKGEWRSRRSPWDFRHQTQQRLSSRKQTFLFRLLKIDPAEAKSTILFYISIKLYILSKGSIVIYLLISSTHISELSSICSWTLLAPRTPADEQECVCRSINKINCINSHTEMNISSRLWSVSESQTDEPFTSQPFRRRLSW